MCVKERAGLFHMNVFPHMLFMHTKLREASAMGLPDRQELLHALPYAQGLCIRAAGMVMLPDM